MNKEETKQSLIEFDPETGTKSLPISVNRFNKYNESSLKVKFNLAFNAFHAAEEKGLLTIQLKDVFEAPLAQRRHHKRSTSSNASSESNISTNSSMSTSTASMSNATSNTTSTNYTPTKKCPLSCGKLGEQTVFNFNDSYVSEYLQQQQHQIPSNNQNLVFNRPITRSITHHNNRLHNEPNNAANPSSTNATTIPTLFSKPFGQPLLINNNNGNDANNILTSPAENSSSSLLLNPPKRMKRCSTILID